MGAGFHHRRLRGGGDRRHGIDHGVDPDRLALGLAEGLTKGFLSPGRQYGGLRHHGCWSCWSDPPACFGKKPDMNVAPSHQSPWLRPPASAGRTRSSPSPCWPRCCAGPFGGLSLFPRPGLCMALFACAFNLLVGYSGLCPFGPCAVFRLGELFRRPCRQGHWLAAGSSHPRRDPGPPPRSASSPAPCRSAARAFISR